MPTESVAGVMMLAMGSSLQILLVSKIALLFPMSIHTKQQSPKQTAMGVATMF